MNKKILIIIISGIILGYIMIGSYNYQLREETHQIDQTCASIYEDEYIKCVDLCRINPKDVCDNEGCASICQEECYLTYIRNLLKCPEIGNEDEFYFDYPFENPEFRNNSLYIPLWTGEKRIVNEDGDRYEKVFRNGTRPAPFVKIYISYESITKEIILESGDSKRGRNYLIDGEIHEWNCRDQIDNDKDGLIDCPLHSINECQNIDTDCCMICNILQEEGLVSEFFYGNPAALYRIEDIEDIQYIYVEVQNFTGIFKGSKLIPLSIEGLIVEKMKYKYRIKFNTSFRVHVKISIYEGNKLIDELEEVSENIYHEFESELDENKVYMLKIDFEKNLPNNYVMKEGIIRFIPTPEGLEIIDNENVEDSRGEPNYFTIGILILGLIGGIIYYKVIKMKSGNKKSKSKK